MVRPSGSPNIAFAPHDGELVFGFVLEGSARLDYAGGHELGPADSFVIPPGEAWLLTGPSADLRLLHVTTAGPSGPLSIASIGCGSRLEGHQFGQSAIAAHCRAAAVLQRGSGDRRDRGRLPRRRCPRRDRLRLRQQQQRPDARGRCESRRGRPHRTPAGQGPCRPPHVRRHRRRHLRHGRRRPDLRSRGRLRRWSICSSPSSSTWSSAPAGTKRKTPIAAATCSGTASSPGLLSGLFGRSFSDIFSGYRVFSRRFVKSFPVLSVGLRDRDRDERPRARAADAGGRGRDRLCGAPRRLAFQAFDLLRRLADPEDDRHPLPHRAAGAVLREHRRAAARSRRSCSRSRW